MQEWLEQIRRRRGLLAMAALLTLSGIWWWRGRPVVQPAGILAPEEPVQAPVEAPEAWTRDGHRITPLADFEIRARVLGAERYRFDRPAELSPVDLALGWGPMSDSRILEAISIRQADRWYFWRAKALPLPVQQITGHSANMHMIPATEGVARRLLSVREGQLVHLKGKLVRVDGKDGWHWISSLTRADTGDGSCEVVWVDSAGIADR